MLNIRVSHDVESYKEPVLGPFDARQSLFVLAAAALGAAVAAGAYFLFHVPLTLCGYAVIPVVAPVICIGFGGKNNMGFLEQQKKIRNRLREPLYYRSTENASCYKESRKEALEKKKAENRKRDAACEVEQTKKKAKRILAALAVFLVLTVLFAAVTSVRDAGI